MKYNIQQPATRYSISAMVKDERQIKIPPGAGVKTLLNAAAQAGWKSLFVRNEDCIEASIVKSVVMDYVLPKVSFALCIMIKTPPSYDEITVTVSSYVDTRNDTLISVCGDLCDDLIAKISND